MQYAHARKGVAQNLSHFLPSRFVFFLFITLSVVLFLTAYASANQVTLLWNPNTEPHLAGYKVYYGTSSRNYQSQIDVGNVTNCTVSGLEAGKTYYFAATAYDGKRLESDFSNEVQASIPTANQAPVALNLSFSMSQDSTLSGNLAASDPDGDPLTYSLMTNPGKGKVTLNNSISGAFTYRPNAGVTGSDAFTFRAGDGKLFSQNATVTINIHPFESRVTQSLQALYTFEEGFGGTVFDVSGVGTPLDLNIGNTARVKWVEGGLSVTGSTIIASTGAATKLVDAVRTSNEITIEAWVKPASVNQNGPARIASLSKDLYSRNLTLGQGIYGGSSEVFDVRLRSTTTDQNGTPSLNSPHGTLSTKLTHVVYTRNAAGTARLYVDGQQKAGRTVGGNLSNWDTATRFALANELTGDRPWLGEFYMVAVYSRALSATEIMQNLNAGSKPYQVKTPPLITKQPENQTVNVGDAVTFRVEAQGSSPIFYQWQRRNGTTWSDIAQATQPSHTVSKTTLEDDNTVYRCRVWNSLGSLTSLEASLTVQGKPGWERVSTSLQALYRFTEGTGSVVRDLSGVGTPLDLNVSNAGRVKWVEGGLAVTGSTLIASPGAATKIINAVRSSGAITVEAWVKPASTNQNGPARIATLSKDLYSRNFTLGQGVYGGSSAVYDMRLRSSTTNQNGTPSLNTPHGTLSTQLTHVVYTRDASGTARLYIDGQQRAGTLVGGNLSNWDTTARLCLGNELTGDRPWLGEFHLIAIYSRALTQDEVHQNFWAGTK